MIRIAIVEDEDLYADKITSYLKRYEEEQNCEFKIRRFRDGDEITNHYRPEYEIILMDIEMPLVDGFTAAQMIREQDSEVVLIFITNVTQYAIRGYSVDALDYVLKPISYFSFSQYLTRAIGRIHRRKAHYLTLMSKGMVHKIDVSSVYYLESRDHSIVVYTENETYVTGGKILDMEKKLQEYQFFRCHVSYVINLEYVEGFCGGEVLLHGTRIPVSRSKKKEFLEVMTEYVNGI